MLYQNKKLQYMFVLLKKLIPKTKTMVHFLVMPQIFGNIGCILHYNQGKNIAKSSDSFSSKFSFDSNLKYPFLGFMLQWIQICSIAKFCTKEMRERHTHTQQKVFASLNGLSWFNCISKRIGIEVTSNILLFFNFNRLILNFTKSLFLELWVKNLYIITEHDLKNDFKF